MPTYDWFVDIVILAGMIGLAALLTVYYIYPDRLIFTVFAGVGAFIATIIILIVVIPACIEKVREEGQACS